LLRRIAEAGRLVDCEREQHPLLCREAPTD
jgi:hypothetical protein